MTCEVALLQLDKRTPEEKENSICPCCGESDKTTKCRRQNTAYIKEISNFIIACDDCFETNEKYWDEMWEEYHTNIQAGIAAGNIAKI